MNTGSIVTIGRGHRGPVATTMKPVLIRQRRQLLAVDTVKQMENAVRHATVDWVMRTGKDEKDAALVAYCEKQRIPVVDSAAAVARVMKEGKESARATAARAADVAASGDTE